MLTAAAHVAVEHGSHVPVIGPGIVFIIIAIPIVGSWLATRGVARLDERYDEADVNGERDA